MLQHTTISSAECLARLCMRIFWLSFPLHLSSFPRSLARLLTLIIWTHWIQMINVKSL